MKKILIYFFLSMLCSKIIYGEEPIPSQITKTTIVEGDEVFFEEESELEEEALLDFEEI